MMVPRGQRVADAWMTISAAMDIRPLLNIPVE
jgi:hypothetical protein